MTEEEHRAAQLDLQRQATALRVQEVELDKARLRLEQERAGRERSFVYRNAATIITACVSLAAAVIAASGPISQYIQKQRELQAQELSREQTGTQERTKLELARIDSDRKWRGDAAGYLATHRDIIFSKNIEDQQKIRDVMVLVFSRRCC
jgi:hypothetical protein